MSKNQLDVEGKELDLVKQCLKGDRLAQKTLYTTYAQVMYNTIYRYLYHHQDTEDLLQISFVKVFRNLHSFNPSKGSLKTWIRKIHIHAVIDFLRKNQIPTIELNSKIYSTPDENDTFGSIDIEYILVCIQQLDKTERAIFNLHEIDGYTHTEIAKLLNINNNTCRVYLSRARKKLQVMVQKEINGPIQNLKQKV